MSTHITVCVCTRNRGARIIRTLRSLGALAYDDFDVIVVDQSRSGDTEAAVQRITHGDPRFQYVRSATTGVSAARNVAVTMARGPLVAFTDDDCQVEPDWLAAIARHFDDRWHVGQICGEVKTGPHDPELGLVPDYTIGEPREIQSPWQKWRERGIGANMAFRLAVLHAVGPFDEILGPGAPLHSCEDGDMTYRVLRAGHAVLSAPDVRVVHYGFRTWKQGQGLMRRTGLGVGAAYMKHLRLGDFAILPTFLAEWIRCISWGRLLLFRRHSGIARFLAYAKGALVSFRYPLDYRQRTYRPLALPQPAEQGWLPLLLHAQKDTIARPYITVVIPTYNRPVDVRQCLESLGQVRYPHWEIILVDQSDDDATRAVCEASPRTRSRLTYLRMREKGLSRARNLAIDASNGDIVAFLDDDCTVQPDWLDTIWAVFRRHPKAALVYGTVHAVSDASGAYVPQYVVKAERRLHGRLGAVQAEGMGASMYLRREACQRVGPFDTWLGAGAHFLSSEDWDYTYRVLAAGGSVVETPEVRVMHHGARDYKSGAASRLLRGNAFSHGALHMKLLRSGQFAVVALIVAEAWRDLLLIRPVNLFLRRGPSNVSRILMYARGLLASFQLSVDRARCLYMPPRGPRWLRRPVGSFLPFRAPRSPNGALGGRADREAAGLHEVPLPFDGG